MPMPPSDNRLGVSRIRIWQLVGSRVAGYVLAVALVFASVVFRILLAPWLGHNVPYLLFFPAVLLAAWFGGFGPGALATASSALASMYLYLPPQGLAVGSAGAWISLALFTFIGLSISWLNHQLRTAEGAHRTAAALATARAERLDTILNTAVDGIIVISDKGVIERFNRGAERLFGYPEGDVMGRNVSALMPAPYHHEHDGYLLRYLQSGHAKIIGTGREVTGRRRDGSLFPLHLSVGEMVVEGERKFTGMLHDLSSRIALEGQLRASEARWRAVIESAVDGVIVIDAHGRIESFNPAAERLFGYPENEVVGRNVNMLMPSPYHEEHDFYLSRYLATGTAKIIGIGREVTGLRKDGTTFPLHLSVGQIRLEGQDRFTGILHDLSGRVQIEQQLREETALARLGEMAAVIAHEVKNPLAGIRGAIEIIGRRLPDASRHAPVVAEILGRIDSLNEMMQDLLLFARPPKPKPLPTDVVPLIATTANLLTQDPALRDVDISVEGSAPPIAADAHMLKIVFQNLLVNGAHAMDGRGRILVRVSTMDSSCHIAFVDHGPGIPGDMREKIFTPFFTTKSRGSGLGLPTAKRLIEAHNGRISIDCPPSGGTTVHIMLPLAAA